MSVKSVLLSYFLLKRKENPAAGQARCPAAPTTGLLVKEAAGAGPEAPGHARWQGGWQAVAMQGRIQGAKASGFPREPGDPEFNVKSDTGTAEPH